MEGVRVVQMTAGSVGSVAASVLAPGCGLDDQLELGGPGRRFFVDVTREEGYTVLLELVTGADVFLTDLEDEARRELRIDLGDLRTRQPGIGLRPLPHHFDLLGRGPRIAICRVAGVDHIPGRVRSRSRPIVTGIKGTKSSPSWIRPGLGC